MHIYDGRYDKKAEPTKHTANIVSAGRCVCTNADHMTVRKNGRADWSLFYCVYGIMYIDDKKINAGQVWIYPPGASQRYIAVSTENTVYRYLHFNGQDIDGLFDSLCIMPLRPITPGKCFDVSAFERLEADAAAGTPLSKIDAEYRILRMFSQLAQGMQAADAASHPHGLMKRVTDDMEHTFAEPYDAARYADMLGVSVSRFNHLFSETVGMPPYAYYTAQRMENAKGLLENTDMKINEIAACSGYTDALYFTQAFKRYTGMTPSAYRNKAR